jgi:hypothetical protein
MINVDTIPSLISLTIIIIVYKKLQPRWLRLFLFILLFTFITDTIANSYSQYFKKSNHFIINISMPFTIGFYFFIFYKIFESKKIKKIVFTSFIIYLLLFVCDITFINGLFYFNIYSYCLGSILIVFCCLLYFMRLFTSDMLINYFKIPMFWIATGLLFYYSGNVVQYSLMWYIIDHELDFIYYPLMVLLNIVLYTAFSISFLCNQVWRKTR